MTLDASLSIYIRLFFFFRFFLLCAILAQAVGSKLLAPKQKAQSNMITKCPRIRLKKIASVVFWQRKQKAMRKLIIELE